MLPDLNAIIESFKIRKYSITKHGYEELDNDSITIEKLEAAIGFDDPEIIENYPDDPRGASCLVQGWFESDLSIHVCIGITGDELEVITAYRPSSLKFFPPDFKRRRQGGSK